MIGGAALPRLMPRMAARIKFGSVVMPACTSEAQNSRMAIEECASQVRMANNSRAITSSPPSEEMMMRIDRWPPALHTWPARR